MTGIRKRLENLKSLGVGTSYPLLLRLMEARQSGKVSVDDLEKCLHLVESFVVRRAVSAVPTNALNKLFLQWARQFPTESHVVWLHDTMSAGAGGRRLPTDSEFGENFRTSAQYGRGSTRFILLKLEESFAHKEPVDLSNTTIEHIMPQTLTETWIAELGPNAQEIHINLLDTFGNLTLTGYNTELGNLSIAEKKAKLQNTHVELSRSLLEQPTWGENQILSRSAWLLEIAIKLWPGPRA